MYAVILKPTWPGTFRRAVRDADGRPIKTLEFALGQPVLLSEAELEAVKGDMGKALVWAALDEDGKPLPKPDYRRNRAESLVPEEPIVEVAQDETEDQPEEKPKRNRRR